MAGPLHRMDMPLDYKLLWANLRIKIQDLLQEQAQRAATEKDMHQVRMYQGGYTFARILLGVMETLVAEARGDTGVKVDADDT